MLNVESLKTYLSVPLNKDCVQHLQFIYFLFHWIDISSMPRFVIKIEFDLSLCSVNTLTYMNMYRTLHHFTFNW